jgi:hypothetical protein
VVVPAGSSSTTFTINTTGINYPSSGAGFVTVSITASIGSSSSASSTFQLDVAYILTFNITPGTVTGGSGGSATATITLNGQAGPGGWTYTIYGPSNTIAQAPATVVIQQFTSSVTFTITTSQVSTQQITSWTTAPPGGFIQPTGILTINPPSLLDEVFSKLRR